MVELIGLLVLIIWACLVLLIFISISDYIRTKRSNKGIVRTPINSTIDELYKQKRTR